LTKPKDRDYKTLAKQKKLRPISKARELELEKLVKEIGKGEYRKYNFTKHSALLIKLFASGGEVCHFCSEVGIAGSTFFEWVVKYPPFKRVYLIAKQLAYEHWLGLLPEDLTTEEGMRFDFKIWSSIMRNRFNFADQRKVELVLFKDAKSSKQQVECITTYISQGALTTQEASQLSNLVANTLKVEERTILNKKVDELEQMLIEKS